MIYILFILLILCLIYLYDYKKAKANKNLVLNILMVLLTLLAGLRYRIGTDTVEYMVFYDTVPSLLDLHLSDFADSRYAPLAFLSFSLAKTVSSNFVVYQLLVSFVVNYSVFRFVKKYCRDGYMFVFILMYFLTSYYMLNCEVLRESLAICIFLFSLDKLYRKQYVKYYALCILAVLFHYGALILFILPLVLKIKVNKYSITILLILYLFAFIIKDYLYLLNYLVSFGRLSDLIEVYSNSASEKEYVFMNFIGFLINILLPLTAYYFVSKESRLNIHSFDQLFYLFLLTFVVSRSIYIFSRYSANYFSFFELYYYSYFIYLCIHKIKKYLQGLLFYYYCLFLVWFIYILFGIRILMKLNSRILQDLKLFIRILTMLPMMSIYLKENLFTVQLIDINSKYISHLIGMVKLHDSSIWNFFGTFFQKYL